MNLAPTEMERLTIFMAAEFARRNRSLGIKLSRPEAVAIIADEMLLAARRGVSYGEIVDIAGNLLTTDDVLPGVAEMISIVSVEASFEEGTKMLVVYDPIHPGREPVHEAVVPGEITVPEGDIELNSGRERVTVEVVNTGDRDIQVRSHAHFFEVNAALEFDRAKAFGMRLDRPSGTGMRFEPGLKKRVDLVCFGGSRTVHGFAGLVNGTIRDEAVKQIAMRRAKARKYKGTGA